MMQEKVMIIQLQLDIRESWGNRLAKDQEEYEALAKCHGDTIQWNPTPQRKNCRHAHQIQTWS